MSDDQKITWKKSSSTQNDVQQDQAILQDTQVDQDLKTSGSSFLKDSEFHDLAKRSADSKTKQENLQKNSSDEIASLQDDIQKLLSDFESEHETATSVEEQVSSTTDSLKNESSAGSAALAAAMGAIDKTKGVVDASGGNSTLGGITSIQEKPATPEEPTKETQEDVKEKIDSLKDSIFAELGTKQKKDSPEVQKDEIFDEQTKKLINQKEKTKGIEQTYYSDLSRAMGANKPGTMSELLEKARYEKEEKKIFSLSSKQNIMYIIGTLVLLSGIIGLILFFVNRNKDTKVHYIKEKRVSALIYADGDTGIDITNIETEKTKQAIRKVLETEIDNNEIQQIYYVKKDEFGNKRRLGIKQVFEATGNNPPELLYQNIENNFMHGFYRVDNKNYPFLILKTLSYDKALDGMKEWEPTMIDDLSTYLDLPPEAGDRSLMEDGFSDDLIQNKTARVARFLPRDVDRRKGVFGSILDFFGGKSEKKIDSSQDASPTQEETTSQEDTLISGNNNSISGNGGGTPVSSTIDVDDNEQTNNDTNQVDNFIEDNTIENIVSYFIDFFNRDNFLTKVYAQSTNKVCYKVTYDCTDFFGKTVVCDENDNTQIKHKIIHNTNADKKYPASYEGQKDYECFETINGSTFIEDKPINDSDVYKCFDEFMNPVPYDPNDPKQTCNVVCYGSTTKYLDAYGKEVDKNDPSVASSYKVIQNRDGDMTYGPDKIGEPGYMCVNTLLGNKAIDAENIIGDIRAEGGDVLCYEKVRKCFDEYGKEEAYNPDSKKQICHYTIFNTKSDPIYTLEDLAGKTDEYIKEHYSCIKTIRGEETIDQSIQGGDNLDCYATHRECVDSSGKPVAYIEGDTTQTCNLIIHNLKSDPVYPGSYQGLVDAYGNPYSCVSSTGQASAIGDFMEGNPNELVCYRSHWECVDTTGRVRRFDGNKPTDTTLTCNKIINNMTPPIYGGITESEKDLYICSGYKDGTELMYSRDPFAWVADLLPDGLILPGGPIGPGTTLNRNITISGNNILNAGPLLRNGNSLRQGTTLNVVEVIQGVLVSLGAMDNVSITGNYDLLTQEVITGFQGVNGLDKTGIIDQDTINVLNNIISGSGEIFGGSQAALINDYIPTNKEFGIGTYSEDVQSMQIILFAEGYDISHLDGVFDRELCNAVRKFEEDNGYTLSDETTCILPGEVIDSFNNLIKANDYLGSGFILNGNGYLIGSGVLKGKDGPGMVGFEVNTAEADSLEEGDIVLLYTFLDEKTILIVRDEPVIHEIIKRRAFNDIFNKTEK